MMHVSSPAPIGPDAAEESPEVVQLTEALSISKGRESVNSIAARLAAIAEEISYIPMSGTGSESSSFRVRSLGCFARRLFRERRARDAFLPAEFRGEPAWDILLDLFAAHEEGKPVSVSSACIAAAVPATTALRYIDAMGKFGLVSRDDCETDKRVRYLSLTPQAQAMMTRLLSRMSEDRELLERDSGSLSPVGRPED
jgi:hypothetical protein